MDELANLVNHAFDDFFQGCTICQQNNREDFMVNRYNDGQSGWFFVATCMKCGKLWSLVSRERMDTFVKVPLI
jgi:hypothetical protein